MESNNKAQIDSLNNLIQINNDRIQGYVTAANETEDGELKAVFSELMQTSQDCRRELSQEVTRMGGEPIEGTTVSGKFYRAWMDVKSALSAKDRKAVLNSCEFGEDVAVKTYESELEGDKLGTLRSLVEGQYTKIKAGHDKIKQLRDAENAKAA